jgi:hypothetical protein
MLLPMLGFIFMLFVFSGIASLACVLDEHGAHRAPIPFAIFFSVLGMGVLAITAGYLGSYISPGLSDSLAFLVGAPLGTIGGGILGYRLGLKRRRRYPSEDV